MAVENALRVVAKGIIRIFLLPCGDVDFRNASVTVAVRIHKNSFSVACDEAENDLYRVAVVWKIGNLYSWTCTN